MINCEYKNRSYGPKAEKPALQRAFETTGMNSVFADSLASNTRSQHALKKAVFTDIKWDEGFVYFRCDKVTQEVNPKTPID